MQQNIFTLLLAFSLGVVLSSYWMVHELKFLSIMNEFNQEISWLIQVPLMLFIAVILLSSLFLFVGTVATFNYAEFKKEVPWKKLIGSIVIFDSIILIFMFVSDLFDIEKNWIGQILVVVLLVSTYIYSSVKYKVNPIFFLVSLATVSGIVLYAVFKIV